MTMMMVMTTTTTTVMMMMITITNVRYSEPPPITLTPQSSPTTSMPYSTPTTLRFQATDERPQKIAAGHGRLQKIALDRGG